MDISKMRLGQELVRRQSFNVIEAMNIELVNSIP